jgi:hypothetical protein
MNDSQAPGATGTTEGPANKTFAEWLAAAWLDSLSADERLRANRAVADFVAGANQAVAMVAQALVTVRGQLIEFAPVIQNVAAGMAQIGATAGAFLEELEALPPRLRQVSLELAGCGWFLDLSMGIPEVRELERMLRDEDQSATELDTAMTAHFESRLSEIEEELVSSHPGRTRIIRQAFAAHRREEFELAILAFLTQADGVCMARTGHLFFQRGRRPLGNPDAPAVAAVVGQFDDALITAAQAALTVISPINASERDRESILRDSGQPIWSHLNRHLVLHGEAVDFGTKTNSLKAISLLNFIDRVTVARTDRAAPSAPNAGARTAPREIVLQVSQGPGGDPA